MTPNEYREFFKLFEKHGDRRCMYVKRFRSGLVWIGTPNAQLWKLKRTMDAIRPSGYEFQQISQYVYKVDRHETNSA